MSKSIIFILLLFLLTSCGDKVEIVHTYQEAMQELKDGNYTIAAEYFEKIEDAKPFTKEANDGLIMSAYSYYKAESYEESLRVIEYFIRANPVNPNLDYLFYLKGLDYQSRITSVYRARDIIEMAKTSFTELLDSYQNSIYRDDTKNRVIELNEMLANNDMIVGDFYLNNKNYIGALNHYKNVVVNFSETKYVPEALYRLIELNDIFAIKIDAVNYFNILNQKYPKNEWRDDAFEIVMEYNK